MVRTIPAIPGNDNTAPKEASTPKMNNILSTRAKFAAKPAV